MATGKSRSRYLYNVHVAEITKNDDATYTASTPVFVKGAIKAKITDNYSADDLYSEDMLEEVVNDYTNSEVEMEFNALSPTELALLFGHINKEGFLIKTAQDNAKEVAFGFATQRTGGKMELTWYYCGKFSNSEGDEYETKGEKTVTKTKSIKGKFYQRRKPTIVDGVSKNFISVTVSEEALQTTDTNALAALTDWFTTVKEPTFAVV
jgi:phi13 family phage major tail protein